MCENWLNDFWRSNICCSAPQHQSRKYTIWDENVDYTKYNALNSYNFIDMKIQWVHIKVQSTYQVRGKYITPHIHNETYIQHEMRFIVCDFHFSDTYWLSFAPTTWTVVWSGDRHAQVTLRSIILGDHIHEHPFVTQCYSLVLCLTQLSRCHLFELWRVTEVDIEWMAGSVNQSQSSIL